MPSFAAADGAIVTDIAVIVIFAICSSVSDALITNFGFNWSTVLLLVAELAVSIGIGYLAGRLIAVFCLRQNRVPFQNYTVAC